jgi:hypothetical protein
LEELLQGDELPGLRINGQIMRAAFGRASARPAIIVEAGTGAT